MTYVENMFMEKEAWKKEAQDQMMRQRHFIKSIKVLETLVGSNSLLNPVCKVAHQLVNSRCVFLSTVIISENNAP